jgi:hypothetical protein
MTVKDVDTEEVWSLGFHSGAKIFTPFGRVSIFLSHPSEAK